MSQSPLSTLELFHLLSVPQKFVVAFGHCCLISRSLCSWVSSFPFSPLPSSCFPPSYLLSFLFLSFSSISYGSTNKNVFNLPCLIGRPTPESPLLNYTILVPVITPIIAKFATYYATKS